MKRIYIGMVFCVLFLLNSIMPVGIPFENNQGPVTIAYANNFDPFSNIEVDDNGMDIGSSTDEMDLKTVLEKYKGALYFGAGIIVITAFTMLFYNLYRLSVSGDNDRKRQAAISGIMISGIGIALLGSFSIIAGLLFGLFQS